MSDTAARRLAAQHVARPTLAGPREVVAWMTAVQAQDHAASLWAIGLRMRRPSLPRIQRAIDRGEILRTWPMRGTLHFVVAEDARWLVALLAGRAVARAAGRRRELGLTSSTIDRARRALVGALAGGTRLTRPQAYEVLAKANLRTSGQRGVHILGHLAQEGTICVGPHEGKRSTIALLDEWAPRSRSAPTSRAEALGELARRFVASHGPAAVSDLAWWGGLTLADARAALAAAGASVREEDGAWSAARPRRASEPSPAAHLLPAFDEFAVAYKDRSAALDRLPRGAANPQIGLLSPSILVDGQMVGTWGRTLAKGRVKVRLKPLVRWSREEREGIEGDAARYADFLGLELQLL